MRRLLAIVFAEAALALGFGLADASAGTYDVVACAAAPAGVNHSWSISTDKPAYISSHTVCPPTDTYDGLAAYDDFAAPGDAPADSGATVTFTAPPGSAITALRYSRYLGKDGDDDWDVFGRTDDGAVFDTCAIPATAIRCSTGQPGYTSGTEATVTGLSTRGLQFGFTCRPTDGATSCASGISLHRVWIALYSATVRLSDLSPPAVSNVGGSAVGDGYLTGTKTATFDATDNSGISSARLYVDGVAKSASTYGCDFTYVVPCSNKTGASLPLDTSSLSDGTHSVQIAASDAAGNEAKSPARSVTIDNTPPAAPENVSVDGGDGWHAQNAFAVTWGNPAGQVAPVAGVRYSICASDGSSCGPVQEAAGTDLDHLDAIAVPNTGEWTMRLWLTDAAGNVDSGRYATAVLRYGTAPASTPSTSSSTTTTTTPAADLGTTGVAASTTDSPASVEAAPFSVALQPIAVPGPSPRLRITSARYSRARLLLRGQTRAGARGILVMRIGATSFTRRIEGGRFRIVLNVRRRRRTALVRFGATQFFSAQTVRIHVR